MRKMLLAACALGATLAAPVAARDIAITFDDLPAHSALPPGVTRLMVAQDIIAALQAAGVPQVYGFINGVQLEREPGTDAVLKAWRDAGFPLGNHGWAHLSLDKIDEATFKSELEKNEPILKRLAGDTDWHWFRFPFLDEAYADPAKRTASRAWLAAHGYKIAAVTASFGDFAFNEPYARCVAKHDDAAIKEMEQAYLDAASASIALSQQTETAQFGRTPPDILLMHIGAFDAHMLPRLIALISRPASASSRCPKPARRARMSGWSTPNCRPCPAARWAMRRARRCWRISGRSAASDGRAPRAGPSDPATIRKAFGLAGVTGSVVQKNIVRRGRWGPPGLTCALSPLRLARSPPRHMPSRPPGGRWRSISLPTT